MRAQPAMALFAASRFHKNKNSWLTKRTGVSPSKQLLLVKSVLQTT